MAIEQTLSIIKPDAVSKNVVGKIISRFEDNSSSGCWKVNSFNR